jgi:hypothetical protein
MYCGYDGNGVKFDGEQHSSVGFHDMSHLQINEESVNELDICRSAVGELQTWKVVATIDKVTNAILIRAVSSVEPARIHLPAGGHRRHSTTGVMKKNEDK